MDSELIHQGRRFSRGPSRPPRPRRRKPPPHHRRRSPALMALAESVRWLWKATVRDPLATFLLGIVLVGIYSGDKGKIGDHSYFATSRGTAILTGMLFGITMLLNVWGVIWRNQKVVLAK